MAGLPQGLDFEGIIRYGSGYGARANRRFAWFPLPPGALRYRGDGDWHPLDALDVMEMEMEKQHRRRHGPQPLAPADRRDHCVSVRLHAADLAWLDEQRGPVRMQRGEYLRSAAMGKLPPQPAPEINRGAWLELARSAANLNQIAHHLNSLGAIESSAEAAQIAAELARFRAALIGAKP